MIVSSEKFVPHSFAHIVERGVFPPGAVPEAAYVQMEKEYANADDIDASRITYESDGPKVTGLSVLPKIITPGKHPVLIYNRGGSGEYGKLTVLSVLRSMAPFARLGYLTFASNYRGNDGGEGSEEFGGRDVDDVTNLLDIATAHPGFDGKNTYMLGHSRGGMMTFLAMKNGAKLNAAITLAAMSDLTHADISPDMDRLYRKRVPGYAQDPATCLRERSAVFWPEKIKAPLMLIHGTNDPVIPHSQSEQLNALLPNEHELVLIEGGNHALVRQWDNVLAHTNRWMERHRA